MLFAVSLGVVLALLVNVCLMLLLRCAGLSSITPGGWQLDTEQPTGLAGERFTRAMGAKSVAWAGLLLIVLYGTSVVYCGAGRACAGRDVLRVPVRRARILTSKFVFTNPCPSVIILFVII